jgi:hypothetical protein
MMARRARLGAKRRGPLTRRHKKLQKSPKDFTSRENTPHGGRFPAERQPANGTARPEYRPDFGRPSPGQKGGALPQTRIGNGVIFLTAVRMIRQGDDAVRQERLVMRLYRYRDEPDDQ